MTRLVIVHDSMCKYAACLPLVFSFVKKAPFSMFQFLWAGTSTTNVFGMNFDDDVDVFVVVVVTLLGRICNYSLRISAPLTRKSEATTPPRMDGISRSPHTFIVSVKLNERCLFNAEENREKYNHYFLIFHIQWHIDFFDLIWNKKRNSLGKQTMKTDDDNKDRRQERNEDWEMNMKWCL